MEATVTTPDTGRGLPRTRRELARILTDHGANHPRQRPRRRPLSVPDPVFDAICRWVDSGSTPLLERTRELLEASPEDLDTIADGAGVGRHWIRKFRSAATPNPGVVSVQAVHDYLLEAEARRALAQPELEAEST